MSERLKQLDSVTTALYDEVDKLNRKWPTMPVSQLTLDKTNKAIDGVRELLSTEGDQFIEDISPIVPAGDMPENRDVVLILGQIKAALHRARREHPAY